MSTKYKVLVLLLVILVSGAVGRYTAPVKIKTETKTVTSDKKTEDKDISKHTHTVTNTVTNKDGTSNTTTVTDTDTGVKDVKSDDKHVDQDSTTEKTRSSSSLTITALGGLDVHAISTPVYGAAVSRSILGPIGVGAWGLTNGTGGLSLSLTF